MSELFFGDDYKPEDHVGDWKSASDTREGMAVTFEVQKQPNLRRGDLNAKSHVWSGPGKALEEHVKLYNQAAASQQAIKMAFTSSLGKPKASNVLDPRMLHWTQFAYTYVSDDESLGLTEGMTTAVKEKGISRDQVLAGNVSLAAFTMMDVEMEMLQKSETLYISDKMKRLVQEAAELAEPEPLFPTDLPTTNGMLFFETPLICDDLHPVTGAVVKDVLPIRAIAWTPTEMRASVEDPTMIEGITLICYLSYDSYLEYEARLGTLLGMKQEEFIVHGAWTDGIVLQACEYNPWGFGTVWGTTPDIHAVGSAVVVDSVGYLRRYVLSLFRIMWQRLIKPEPWDPDRALRKRLARDADKLNQRAIKPKVATVLHLRRFIEDSKWVKADESTGAWPFPYRIQVRPHWRRQYFPSLGKHRNEDGTFNHESHRLVFIARHYRGPEHLPIQERREVTAIVR